MQLTSNSNKEISKLISIIRHVFNTSGMNFTPWCRKHNFHVSRMSQILDPLREHDVMLHPILGMLMKIGCTIEFSIEVPGLPQKTTVHAYDSLPGLRKYVQNNIVMWASANSYSNKKVASILGIPKRFVDVYLSDYQNRSTIFMNVKDFEKVGFKFHCDIKFNGEYVKDYESTISAIMSNKPKDKNPNETFGNDSELDMIIRKKAFSDALISIYKSKYSSIASFAKANGYSESAASVYVTSGVAHRVSIETFSNVLRILGATLIVDLSVGNYRETFELTDDKFVTNSTIAVFVRKYMENKGVTIKAAAAAIDIDYYAMRSRLNPTRDKTYTLTSISEVIGKLGIDVMVTIKHPAISDTTIVMNHTDGVLVIQKIMEAPQKEMRRYIKSESFEHFINNEMISNMARGQVKTSMGETIRPFL